MIERPDSAGRPINDTDADARLAGAEPGADLIELALPELTRRVQTAPLPPPIQNPTLLPLSSLEPEVLERVVAEVVSRQDNLGVQFYGRRGQKQYGLDIVERDKSRQRSLYQVRRYEELTGQKLRSAIEDYAGPPSNPDASSELRRFNPSRFVVVTSAELDRDTANVDTLAALQDAYQGDLDVEVWGAEALSRKLRDLPNLVWAVFGPSWAKAFCGFDRPPQERVGPKPLGLVEAPVAVLGLEALEQDAVACEKTDAARAAHLYEVVAQGLDEGGFPGHASEMRRRRARVARAGGDSAAAFEILFHLAISGVLTGDDVRFGSLRHELEEVVAELDPLKGAKAAVLESIADWYEEGSDLDTAVPALHRLSAADDPHWALLCCLVIEQALVDGLYDFAPPRPVIAAVGANTSARLAELRELARSAHHNDVVIRTRLRCAVADTQLAEGTRPGDAEAAFGSIVSEASAGRLLHARGLALSRAARAFAVRGDLERAENIWRQAILATSEDGLYGDTRGAIRALRSLAWESGRIVPGLDIAVSALPNRRRLLAATQDPVVGALESIHNERLPDALGDVRRHLWESRIGGHLYDEQVAGSLLGDVLAAGRYPEHAVETYVAAGNAKKAAKLARQLPEPVDVVPWTKTAQRASTAAATQVIGAQSRTFGDDEVGQVLDTLLLVASPLWQSRWVNPQPEIDAVKAIAAFGVRIPESAIGRIIRLSEPAISANIRGGDDIANLLVQAYWAVESRRDDVARALTRMLRQPSPPHNLWGLICNIPRDGRGPLLQTVRDLANDGRYDAIRTLAHWKEAPAVVQLAARRACAALLRRPVGVERDSVLLGTQEDATVELLLNLLEADPLVDVPMSELGPAKARPAGGLIFASSRVAAVGETPQRTEPSPGEEEAADPDTAARTAGGPPPKLAIAVAEHLVAMAEDQLDGAVARAQAIRALRRLLPAIPRHNAEELSLRLAVLHDNPNLSEDDLFEIQSDTPLSRARIRTGGEQLAGLALVAAAEGFQVDRNPSDGITANKREFLNRLAAAAAVLLRDADGETRVLGALALRAVASTAPEFEPLFNGLLFHADERIRAQGAATAPITMPMFETLASDPSPTVRQAVASRGQELPKDLLEDLAADPHLGVRHTAKNALRGP